MNKFQKTDLVGGIVAFVISAITYLLTIEPTASFWDCGEFISTAYNLEVGHPPGAPFFMLMGKFFTLFASDVHQVAKMVNVMSAIMSALTILFLYFTISHIARRLVVGGWGVKEGISTENTIKIVGSALIGSLAYAFTDTFWFSAVEAEVYASSSMFTALTFWAILKWEDCADEPYANRWLILIAYLIGLSVGVHLLNLLCIPPLVLIYYFRKYDANVKGIFIAFGISLVILAVVLYGVIPGFVTVAGWFELFFVNSCGFSFNTGTIIYSILLVICLISGVYFTSFGAALLESKLGEKNGRIIIGILFVLTAVLLGIPFFGSHYKLGIVIILAMIGSLIYFDKKIKYSVLNTILLSFTVILIGYASYATLIIRSSANPPMDQNSPDDVFSLKSYLNRDQYGDTPLLYGESYAAEMLYNSDGRVMTEDGEALYAKKIKDNDNEPDLYYNYDTKKKYKYQPQFLMPFPRMYSRQPQHVKAYKQWGGVTDQKKVKNNKGERVAVPTFANNLQYFFKYQIGFMYWRYFMWNFVGRQNDIQGHGEITNGNWISGIDFIDNFLVGNQETLPDNLKHNKGRNTYYFLPLLLGLAGISFQIRKGFRNKLKTVEIQSFIVVLTLFIMTGLAIVVYLNQYPFQPRERDYAYAASFYAFCIWIGLGVLYLDEIIGKFVDKRIAAAAATVLSLSVPTILAVENWDDHDRSGRYVCRDYGAGYLNSMAPNGLIFTNGDNDTFPLWYNQEVEQVGRDQRVANLSYLQMGWYIDQMQMDAYDSKALPMSLKSKDYSNGELDVAYVVNRYEAVSVEQAIYFATHKELSRKIGINDEVSVIPSRKLYLPVNKDAVAKAGIFKESELSNVVDTIWIDLGEKRYLGKQDMFILDLINSNKDWKRPIYFAVTVGGDSHLGLSKYLRLEGMAYRLVPMIKNRAVEPDIMYDNMMNKMAWGGVDVPGIYMDENAQRMAKTYRHMMCSLAGALVNNGDKKRAIEVLDKTMEKIPTCNVEIDWTIAQIASIYNICGENDKAQKINTEILEQCCQYHHWFNSLNTSQKKSAISECGEMLGIMQSVFESNRRGIMPEYLENYKPKFEAFYNNLAPYLD